MTYLDLIRASATPDRAVTFLTDLDETGTPVRVSWKTMWDDACRYASVMAHHGIQTGSHVAMLGRTSRQLVTAIEACWLMGATVMILPVPTRMPSIDAFIDTCRNRLAAGDADALLLDSDLTAFIPPPQPAPWVISLDELAEQAHQPTITGYTPGIGQTETDAILQFTSGSTSEPKGVRISYDVLESNSNDINQRLHLDPTSDVCVSWLPLYHDMGLVGILGSCMSRGLDLVLASPLDFMTRPAMWLEAIATYRGTITSGPNFAYELAARALNNHDGPPLDLSCLRIAINGAEPVRPDTMRNFTRAGRVHGLDPGCVFPAFGMAETGIAGFFPPVGRGLVTETAHRHTLTTGHYVQQLPGTDTNGTEQVLCGTTVPGVNARIAHPDTGEQLPARHVGELQLSGRGITSGYYNAPDANAERFTSDGWLRTGDLAYLTDEGEAVICGRIKDLIIIGGINYYPQDIELAAQTVEGVRAGNAIAFGIELDSTEHVVVVAEATGTPDRTVARAARRAVAANCGINPREVLMVPKGTLPKTSSGKLQRSAAKSAYLDGHYTDLEVGP